MTAPRPRTGHHGCPRPCPGCQRVRVLHREAGTCWVCVDTASRVAAEAARWEQTAAFERRLRAERGAA